MGPGSTARQIWDSIANLFHDNKKSRALALDAEFRNTPQGDMSVHDYCAKLKSLADALGDVGEKISDETLVLTVLRGLNEQYSHLRSFLPYQVPFPSFLQTRSALVLEETQKKADAKTASATALWASGNSVLPPGGGAPPSTPPADRGSASSLTDPRHTALVPYSNPGRGGGYGGHRGRGGGRGRGRDNNNPWMFNPWTGLPTRAGQQQQQSSPPPWQQPPSAPWQPRWRAPGLLGPRPGAAYTAYGHQQPPNGTPQHLDPALLTALQNLQLHGNQEWVMDTGASSHMASDYEGNKDNEVEDQEAPDEPADDDLGRAIADARRECETEKERLAFDKMIEDHNKLLYPTCEDGHKKLGSTLELLQWKAENGVTDSGFGKLLTIIKRKLPRGNELPASAKKIICPLGLDVQKIHACINDCILYRDEYENLDACPVCTALRYKIRRDDPGDVEGERPRKRVLPRLCAHAEQRRNPQWHPDYSPTWESFFINRRERALARHEAARLLRTSTRPAVGRGGATELSRASWPTVAPACATLSPSPRVLSRRGLTTATPMPDDDDGDYDDYGGEYYRARHEYD
ncbi:hypothetical protein QYE76_036463 [Lolium multiflorum]|uniref:Uncharacterized protein n=1 Tax=Lolium multiflorum TaxID=4521 RepID=A0AAD8R2H3_LOLMU|nr:hypothetical protein QYE76_036463 [Lolium multiflorum]